MPSSGSLEVKRWLREWGRLYILFMSVGFSAIPIGIAYGFLNIKGYDSLWVAGLAVTCGLLLGRASWKFVDSKFFGAKQGLTSAAEIYVLAAEGELWLNTSGTSSLESIPNGLMPSFGETSDSVGERTAGGMQTAPEEEYACAAN
jgi:hypothetical protein